MPLRAQRVGNRRYVGLAGTVVEEKYIIVRGRDHLVSSLRPLLRGSLLGLGDWP